MTVNLNNTPSFSGLKIASNVPPKVRKAIFSNPVVKEDANLYNLSFNIYPRHYENDCGVLLCVISPLKKSIWDYINPLRILSAKHEICIGTSKSGFSAAIRALKKIAQKRHYFAKEFADDADKIPVEKVLSDTIMMRNNHLYGTHFDQYQK